MVVVVADPRFVAGDRPGRLDPAHQTRGGQRVRARRRPPGATRRAGRRARHGRSCRCRRADVHTPPRGPRAEDGSRGGQPPQLLRVIRRRGHMTIMPLFWNQSRLDLGRVRARPTPDARGRIGRFARVPGLATILVITQRIDSVSERAVGVVPLLPCEAAGCMVAGRRTARQTNARHPTETARVPHEESVVRTGEIKALSGLRIVAALWVVLFHFRPLLEQAAPGFSVGARADPRLRRPGRRPVLHPQRVRADVELSRPDGRVLVDARPRCTSCGCGWPGSGRCIW